MEFIVGTNVQRKESWDKVTGKAEYTDDLPQVGMLSARLLTSTVAHGKIRNMDTSKALALEGVCAVLTGDQYRELFGPLVLDRPALARDVVRYAGEPVALVVAKDESTAEKAVRMITVEYDAMPCVLTPTEALSENAVFVHPKVNGYKKLMTDIYPEAGTNIASRYKIRKGNAEEVLAKCDVVVQKRFTLAPSDHLAMEVRTAQAEITADGKVQITTCSQAPYVVRKQISDAFHIPAGKIQVNVPFVGGAFGGKAPVFLEILAFLASRSVGGRAVRLTIPREQDMASAPCRLGLEAEIKIGASKEGVLQAAALTYWLDCGAYTDISPYMAKAIAVGCTGPYNIAHVWCDSICVYTNHTYATSYRGFAHESYAFCIERVIDMIAKQCGIDPMTIREKNAIAPGHLTPTQITCSENLMGDLGACLTKIKPLSQWDTGSVVRIDENRVRTKGIACFWKTENPPPDASASAILTFNADGSINLNTGVVEMGSGGQTNLAVILAERLKIPVDQIHVILPVDTQSSPEYWKTVASLTEYMAGHAVMRAADELIQQLQQTGGQALGCLPSEIEVANGRVYAKKNPEQFIAFKDIVHGYQSPSGESIGAPALGSGGFMLKGLTQLNPQTGAGKTGPAWTVGAQVVEIEVDLKEFTYRILSASTVMDIGKAINPQLMESMIAGGMAMGISLASRETYTYDSKGILETPNLRSYKPIHIGQEPKYYVDFVETPEPESPYGVRSYAEHGIIGIPAALGNALATAFGTEFTFLPLTPEKIWNAAKGECK